MVMIDGDDMIETTTPPLIHPLPLEVKALYNFHPSYPSPPSSTPPSSLFFPHFPFLSLCPYLFFLLTPFLYLPPSLTLLICLPLPSLVLFSQFLLPSYPSTPLSFFFSPFLYLSLPLPSSSPNRHLPDTIKFR